MHGTTVSGADIVTVLGDLDIYTSEHLRDHVTASGYTAQVLVIDLNGVAFLDSQGLACLLRIRRLLATRSAELVLVTAQPRTLRILQIAGFHQFMRITSTVVAAIPPPAE